MTVPLRDAATVIVLRGSGTLEVLLLRRHAGSGFAASAWVFPGGVVDPADTRLHPACWEGADPIALAPLVGRSPEVALGLCVAAVRETFEESGLLFARRPDGTRLDLGDPDIVALRRATARFHTALAETGLVLDLGALRPFSRWLTPESEPRRYDAIFFVARAPEDQVADHDRVETTESRWLTPADALAGHARGEFDLMFPTARTLEALADLGDLEAILASVPPGTRLRPLLPHLELDAEGRVAAIIHPDDPAYPWERYPQRGGTGGWAS
jgi:8-oxo-dGTP pyrophosphatase MutT (NUDIX family)